MKNISAVLVLLLTAAFIAAPSVTTPFMGYDPASFPVVIARPSIQPAGYAFALWGIIYLWLLVHAVFGMTRRLDAVWERVRLPHLGSLALGTAWLAIASGYPLTATVAIVVMAGFTLAAFIAADPAQDRWLLQGPLGLFAGWLTAASMVSVGVMVAGYGWLSDTTTALAMLAVILVTAIAVQTRRPSMPTYSAAVVWAAIGVAVVNWQDNPTVAYAAAFGAVIQATVALRAFARR
jgi:hypothetical protein